MESPDKSVVPESIVAPIINAPWPDISKTIREEPVRTGVAVVILNQHGQILLGKRINCTNAGVFALPGGRMEYGESPEQTVVREVLEETGLRVTVTNVRPMGWTNDYLPADMEHWITLIYVVTVFDGVVQNMEPHKNEGWGWYELNQTPEPLWAKIEPILDSLQVARALGTDVTPAFTA